MANFLLVLILLVPLLLVLLSLLFPAPPLFGINKAPLLFSTG
jgi:hypothetical protein